MQTPPDVVGFLFVLRAAQFSVILPHLCFTVPCSRELHGFAFSWIGNHTVYCTYYICYFWFISLFFQLTSHGVYNSDGTIRVSEMDRGTLKHGLFPYSK